MEYLNSLKEEETLFKSGLTSSLYNSFLESYQTATSVTQTHRPFVYVDDEGIRLVADVMSEGMDSDEVVAITVVQDGLMEILALD